MSIWYRDVVIITFHKYTLVLIFYMCYSQSRSSVNGVVVTCNPSKVELRVRFPLNAFKSAVNKLFLFRVQDRICHDAKVMLKYTFSEKVYLSIFTQKVYLSILKGILKHFHKTTIW